MAWWPRCGAAALAAALLYLARSRRRPSPPPPLTMAAVVARDGRCVVERQWPTPEAAPGEVLVRVRATAVNRLDCAQREGKSPVPPGVTEVLGLEASGTVVACGSNVRQFSPGDEVMALVSGGSYAEFVAVDARTVFLKPPSLSWSAAASIPESWLTAYKLVHVVGQVRAGETVLVHAAASGVGLAAIQLIVNAGAIPIVTVGSAAKLSLCVRLGAKGGAVRHDGPWADSIMALAPSGKVDVILDCVAGAYAAQNIEVLAIDGRWVLYSLLSGGGEDKFTPLNTYTFARLAHSIMPVAALAPEDLGKTFLTLLMKKRISLLATTLRTRPISFKQALVERFVADVLPKLASGKMELVIDREYTGLGEAQAAHDFMQTNGNFGKIVIAL